MEAGDWGMGSRDSVVSGRSVKISRADSERQIPRSLYDNNCVEFGAAKFRNYPAKPDSQRGDSVRLAPGCKPSASLCATIGARLERKGGHDECFGMRVAVWKVSPLS